MNIFRKWRLRSIINAAAADDPNAAEDLRSARGMHAQFLALNNVLRWRGDRHPLALWMEVAAPMLPPKVRVEWMSTLGAIEARVRRARRPEPPMLG